MPSGQGGACSSSSPGLFSTNAWSLAGTNPIHNKQKRKAQKEEDEDDVAYKQKQAAGKSVRVHRSHHEEMQCKLTMGIFGRQESPRGNEEEGGR